MRGGCPGSAALTEYGGGVQVRLVSAVVAAGWALLPAAALATAPPESAPASPPPTSVPDTAPLEEGGTVDGAVTPEAPPPVALPLIPVPAGCEPAPTAHVVFLGTVIDRDFRTIRFAVDQVRAGRTAPFAAPLGRGGTGEVIDVRYGLDVQYLADGRQYLVGAVVDPDLGVLVSRVEPEIENFGGDEVIGMSETDVDCPVFDPPGITVHPDGSPVEGSMLDSFFDAKWRIAAAVVVPLALACAALFGLSAVRLSINGLLRGVCRPRRA